MPRDIHVSESLALRILAALPEEAISKLSAELRGEESDQMAALASKLHVARRMRERAENDPDRSRGLYDKYRVERVDGSTADGKKHDHCRHFVLDADHDPIAPLCLNFYADLCESTYPQLARDLRKLTGGIDL
jgi:hypothetical protein